MNLQELLINQPPVRIIKNARSLIRQELIDSGKRMVIIDDDPTGPQAVHDVRVYMDWSIDTLRKAFRTKDPVFFICTNSRSLNPAEMKEITLEAGQNIREAAAMENVEVLLTSRSDSTLRGHFPDEVYALMAGMNVKPDGIILAPVFLEAGRYTINDIQYAEIDGNILPVNLTEFSRDPSFSYRNSNLKKWVEEKTLGRIKADKVMSISLRTIREGGPEAVTKELLKASGTLVIIANAACYEDLEILCLGISDAEKQGKTFFYRCSASFIKARGGFNDTPLLTCQELKPGKSPGLVIAGSYVEKTTRQLQKLFNSGLAEGIELHIDRLADSRTADIEIDTAIDYVNKKLISGVTTAVYTSRSVTKNGANFQETGRAIMDSLCRIVATITEKPGFIIAKGGITSIELARSALKSNEAFAIGQILPGVPVWRLLDGVKWTDIPYVVFPGNVGNEDALVNAVRVLNGR